MFLLKGSIFTEPLLFLLLTLILFVSLLIQWNICIYQSLVFSLAFLLSCVNLCPIHQCWSHNSFVQSLFYFNAVLFLAFYITLFIVFWLSWSQILEVICINFWCSWTWTQKSSIYLTQVLWLSLFFVQLLNQLNILFWQIPYSHCISQHL